MVFLAFESADRFRSCWLLSFLPGLGSRDLRRWYFQEIKASWDVVSKVISKVIIGMAIRRSLISPDLTLLNY